MADGTHANAGPEVLVAGAGPAGLTAAHELARRGVRVRVVDKAAGPAVTSRALATHARTLEVYDQMGVLAEVLPLGRRVVHFTLHQGGRTLVRFDTNYADLPTRFPFSLMVDQVKTEQVLRQALARYGVQVEWATALEDFDQDTAGVTAVLRGPGGTTEQRVGWLVGADGGHSLVRTRLGLPLLGEATETWLNADIVLSGDGLPPDSNHLLHAGKGSILLVPFPEHGKWRAVDTADVTGADDDEAVRAALALKISRALGRTVTVAKPTWVSVFTAQQRMIPQMRAGRCFLVGDAAHVHSPASGQGMNTGIQDSYNLAWKLADVVHGHAADSLLDSYSAERVPVGRALLGSTRTATALVALRAVAAPVVLPAGLAVVRHLPPLKRRIEGKIIRGFCGLALNYRDSPLTGTGPEPQRTRTRPGDRVACDAQSIQVSAGWRQVCEELRDPRWTLLAFPGPHEAGDPLAALAEVAREHGAAVSVRIVTETETGEQAAGPAETLADPGGILRRDLGLRLGECALIRPDGYLAAVSRPGDLAGVLRDRGLRPGHPAAAPGAQAGSVTG
jgi:NADPH-dependent dioxygenase